MNYWMNLIMMILVEILLKDEQLFELILLVNLHMHHVDVDHRVHVKIINKL